MALSFIGGGKSEYSEKTTDLSQVTDKLYHIMLYTICLEINNANKDILSLAYMYIYLLYQGYIITQEHFNKSYFTKKDITIKHNNIFGVLTFMP